MRVWNVYMDHFIGDLGHIDATQKKHWVPRRLFKITDDLEYPLESHPVLTGDFKEEGFCDRAKIFHLGHLPVEYMKYIQKRYKEHEYNSIVHTKKFLKQWRDAHLFGVYPKRQIDPTQIPKIILDNFGIDFDELYFRNRQEMTVQHYQDCMDWKKFFKCETSYEFGCGFGQRVSILNKIGVEAFGLEISKYAFDNSFDTNIQHGDITKVEDVGSMDLVIAYDILEHLKYKYLEKAIDILIKTSNKHILISVPYKGTPPATADPTHIIIEDREFWIKKFTDKGLKLIKTPDHFQYKEQILIFEKVIK